MQLTKEKLAQKTLERDYSKYVNSIYNTENDLFAAYPLWIDTQSVKSELNFLATQSGQYISANPSRIAPVPEGEIKTIPTPSPTLSISEEELPGGTGPVECKEYPVLTLHRGTLLFRKPDGRLQDSVPALPPAAF